MSTEAKIVRTLRKAGFRVLTRKQWGSRHLAVYQTRRVTRRFVGAADHAFAHISVTNASDNAAQDARTIEDIGMARFGTGWSYNWGLHLPSRTIIVGQPHDAAGAHTLNDKKIAGFPENLNYWGHAIVWMGNVGDQWSPWAEKAAAAIIRSEKKHGAMKRTARIYPHSKFAYKDCPTDPFRNALDRVLALSRSQILDGAEEDRVTAEERRAERRAQRKAERKAARKEERKAERRAARRQRARDELWARASGETSEGRVDRGRALIRIASNKAQEAGHKERASRLRAWLKQFTNKAV